MKPKKKTAETPEEIVARLEKELPEGYVIGKEVIDFSDYKYTPPEPPRKEPLPPPPQRHHVVFEKDRLWDDDDNVVRTEQMTKVMPAPPFGLNWPPQLSLTQIEAFSERLASEWYQLTNAALYAADARAKEAAGRAVANFVSKVLNLWPEKKNLKTCVSETIKKIKRDNEGFKQRWQKELHITGVPKKRTKKGDKQLQRFVRKANLRLQLLEDEVIDLAFALVGIYSDGPKIASWKEAFSLLDWMSDLPGFHELLLDVEEGRLETHGASLRIKKLIDKAKVQNVEGYFRKVFRPALEDGLWHKWGDLPEGKFTDWQGVMLTMLKLEIYRRAD